MDCQNESPGLNKVSSSVLFILRMDPSSHSEREGAIVFVFLQHSGKQPVVKFLIK